MDVRDVRNIVHLEPDSAKRSKAICVSGVTAGAKVLKALPLATVLLPSEKGRRCDACLLSPASLQRCSGCASYWYCDLQCQIMQWKSHKKFCTNLNQYQASSYFQRLETHEKLDALLLTHLVADILSNRSLVSDHARLLATFQSLLTSPPIGMATPLICPMDVAEVDPTKVSALYSRFANNNFAVHSHLTTIAHGIFPLASRLFNHSCMPNAAVRYIIKPSQLVHMEVVALQDIFPGEEICISYLDPALLQTRRQILQLTYGFDCTCPSCTLLHEMERSPRLLESELDSAALAQALPSFVFPSSRQGDFDIQLPKTLFSNVPSTLLPAFRESYISDLSERWSKASHEGQYDSALDIGLTLLALYCLIYPPNYPQVGMHLLEMAKTAWNATIVADFETGRADLQHLLRKARLYLGLGHDILAILGLEGDPGGPLEEVQVLQRLLDGS